jgi:glutathione S-transferase
MVPPQFLPNTHLLYVYPWMPFPRRTTIYLRERKIPSNLVIVVPVSDPKDGEEVPPGFPPRPKGSLPLLAIPKSLVSNSAEAQRRDVDLGSDYYLLGESLSIMQYLEDLCDTGKHGFPISAYSMAGPSHPLDRAYEYGLLNLANEVLVSFNPVRMFGSALGFLKIPEAARESLRWMHRHLAAIERHLANSCRAMDFDVLRDNENGNLTMGEIVLYQYLESMYEIYSIDVTKGNPVDKSTDVYGREVLVEYPALKAFYQAFKTRDSVQVSLEDGSRPTDKMKESGRIWWPGSGLEDSLEAPL